jgi:membrane-associated phospholipid phosphatase
VTARTQETSWWRSTWPLDRRDGLHLVVALVAVVAAFSAIGYLYTDAWAPNAITELDERVAQDFVEQRTEARNDLAHWGSMLSETQVKIGLTAVAAGLMLAVWRRWHEALFVVTCLVFEATAFITITYIVARERPAVERLLDSPVSSSFPSGHVAAATVYSAFVVVVFWHTRRLWIRALAASVCTLVVVAVALSRMYQGMHFLTDVIAGIALGLVSLAVCLWVFGPPVDDPGDRSDDSATPDDQATRSRYSGLRSTNSATNQQTGTIDRPLDRTSSSA